MLAVAPPPAHPDTAPPAPPEEGLWQRYSAHSEAPLSGLGAFLLHALVAGPVLVLGALIYYGLLDWDRPRPEPPVRVVELLKRGGNGAGNRGGSGVGTGGQGEAGEKQGGFDREGTPTEAGSDLGKLDEVKMSAAQLAIPENLQQAFKSRDPRNITAAANAMSYAETDANIKKQLANAIRTGPTGPGSPTGKGQGESGTGTGDKGGKGGNDHGSGQGEILNQREQRLVRWALHFPANRDVRDYLRQLDSLGAILVVPDVSSGSKKYKVVEQLLVTPARLLDRDLASLGRLPFYEQSPQNAAAVAQYLQLRMPPGERYHILWPQRLEQRMAEMELAAANGKSVDDIKMTVFEVVPNGSGGWDVKVEKIVPAR